MNIIDIARNDIPAVLAYLDQRFDRGLLLKADQYAILLQLQDHADALIEAMQKHVAERLLQGKPVPAAQLKG